jgi:Mrp family chromosome partitioning ATPase
MSRLKTALESARKKREASQGLSSGSLVGGQATVAAHPLPSGDDLLRMGKVRRVPANWEAFKANRILTQDAHSPAVSAYRMLRTRLMQKMRSHGWRILGVSSLGQNEGKTFTAINLAISIAAEIGQEAVLVDLDLRRPSVFTYLGIDAGQFTSSTRYLEGSVADIGELLICPGVDRLGCLLSADSLDQPSDVLASPHGKRLFDDLRRRLPPETVVIVDLPPLLAVDDALAVAPMLDGLLLVVAEGYAKRNEIADARELLQEFNVIGTLLNKSVETDNRKHYYY